MYKGIFKIFIYSIIIITIISCEKRNPLFNPATLDNDNPSNNTSSGSYKSKYGPLSYNPAEYWIKDVIEYKPAWGQFVNNTSFNDPDKLYSHPYGNGTCAPDNSSIISLGSAGGYVIVRFDPPILNHSKNINGYDFIIFGNAMWNGGNPNQHWQEPAYILVMKDENSNDIPDETWYLLKGSDTTPGDFLTLTYHRTNTIYLPSNKSHYPSTAYYPGYPDEVTFNFFTFPFDKAGGTGDAIWGYADVTPTMKLGDMSGADGVNDNSLNDPEDIPDIEPEYFYTIPDTHDNLHIDAGSGGGDAFKIEWAVDTNTGVMVSLDQIDFIKIVSTVTGVTGCCGEISPEIDAVARVKRNNASE